MSSVDGGDKTFRRGVRLCSALAVALASLIAAASASGSVTLGAPEFQNSGQELFDDTTVIQTTSFNDRYQAPFDGVITSWSKFASLDSNNLQQLKLKVGRLTSGNWRIVGSSTLETLTHPAEVNTFNTRIPVQQDDAIGLYSANEGPLTVADASGYGIFFHPGDLAPGSSENLFGGTDDIVVVFAKLEPDEDGDGFGDESQDDCVGQRGPDGGCVPAKCAGKNATVTGGPKGEILRGTPHKDIIAGLGGRDTIKGLAGNDILCGGAGRDKLIGGAGRDKLIGGAGRDVLRGGPGRDTQVQ